MTDKPKRARGGPNRESVYSDAILDEICERLCKGEPLAQICRDDHMPGLSTVYDWIHAREDVAAKIARARLSGEESIAADCLTIADYADDAAKGKLRVWTRLELLKRWNPKKWGDRIQQEVSGPDGKPLETKLEIEVRGI